MAAKARTPRTILRFSRLRVLAGAAALAILASGCQSRGPETTGAIESGGGDSQAWGGRVQEYAARFDANPNDRDAALGYARALRATGQKTQAVAVLQQAALRSPQDTELLAAYGKALADAGRLAEASQVLGNAHLPERPDWRILSAQGTIADQTGNPAEAQRYYEAALRIVPDEPRVLSNLGLSYALSKRLTEGEATLRRAASRPGADGRVRQNLALVLGLQGKFGEAEEVLRRDLGPAEAAANIASMRRLVAQPNSWRAIQGAERKAKVAAAQ